MMLLGAGLILLYPGWVEDLIGFFLFMLVFVLQGLRRVHNDLAPTRANAGTR
jgi:UPF0716 family protein affecting phage T7 exclusion